jgi:hypothetical protein
VNKQRRHFSGAEKVAILKRHLRFQAEVGNAAATDAVNITGRWSTHNRSWRSLTELVPLYLCGAV